MVVLLAFVVELLTTAVRQTLPFILAIFLLYSYYLMLVTCRALYSCYHTQFLHKAVRSYLNVTDKETEATNG